MVDKFRVVETGIGMFLLQYYHVGKNEWLKIEDYIDEDEAVQAFNKVVKSNTIVRIVVEN